MFIDCLFGIGESKVIIEFGWDGNFVCILYNKYLELLDIIFGFFEVDDVDVGLVNFVVVEVVFFVFDIICCVGFLEEYRGELWRCIENYFGSKVWYVCEIVVRIFCFFLLREDWVFEIGKFFE